MNKKGFTALFTVISTILNIIMMFVIIMTLVILSTALIYRLLKVHNSTVISIAWIVSFFGGMGLSMWLFVKITGWVIKKFNLEDKLDPRVLGKYSQTTGKPYSVQKEAPAKKKTNMPSSVQRKQDTWAEDKAAEAAQAQEMFPLNQEIKLDIPQSEEMTDENAEILAAQNLFPLRHDDE